jgi:hypothetical protein
MKISGGPGVRNQLQGAVSARPPNKRINLTVASVTPLALVPSSVHPALGEQQAARRPAASAADATAGYAQR